MNTRYRWLLVLLMAFQAAIMFALYRWNGGLKSDLVVGMFYVLLAIMLIPIKPCNKRHRRK